MRRPTVAALACAATLLAAPLSARADDADAFAASMAGSATLALFVVDVGFLGYDLSVSQDSHADSGVMTAQTIVAAPQAILLDALFAYGQVDDDDSAAFTLGAMVPAMWMNSMTTFGAWTLSSEELPGSDRLAASFLIGSSATFTTGAVTSLFRDDHLATPYLSIPEIAVQGAEAFGCFAWGAGDGAHRAEWLALGAWSTLLTAHGVVSVVGWAQGPGRAADAKREASRAPGTAPWSLAVSPGPFSGGEGPRFTVSGVF